MSTMGPTGHTGEHIVSAPQAGMQRSASQQLLIGQSEPEGPSTLIPVAATAAPPPISQGTLLLPGMMMPGQVMTYEQVWL